jgi:hypothetical protein
MLVDAIRSGKNSDIMSNGNETNIGGHSYQGGSKYNGSDHSKQGNNGSNGNNGGSSTFKAPERFAADYALDNENENGEDIGADGK